MTLKIVEPVRYCEICQNQMQKRKGETSAQFKQRKFCGLKCNGANTKTRRAVSRNRKFTVRRSTANQKGRIRTKTILAGILDRLIAKQDRIKAKRDETD